MSKFYAPTYSDSIVGEYDEGGQVRVFFRMPIKESDPERVAIQVGTHDIVWVDVEELATLAERFQYQTDNESYGELTVSAHSHHAWLIMLGALALFMLAIVVPIIMVLR